VSLRFQGQAMVANRLMHGTFLMMMMMMMIDARIPCACGMMGYIFAASSRKVEHMVKAEPYFLPSKWEI